MEVAKIWPKLEFSRLVVTFRTQFLQRAMANDNALSLNQTGPCPLSKKTISEEGFYES